MKGPARLPGPLSYALRWLALCLAFQRQIADTLSSGREQRVGQRRSGRRQARFAQPAHLRVARHELDMDFRCARHLQNRIVREARLHDRAFVDRDFFADRGRQAHHDPALDLRFAG